MTVTPILVNVLLPSTLSTGLAASALLLLHRVRYGEWRAKSRSLKRFLFGTWIMATSYQFWNYKAAQVHKDSLQRLGDVVSGTRDMRYTSAAPIVSLADS